MTPEQMNAPAAPLISRLRAEIADLKEKRDAANEHRAKMEQLATPAEYVVEQNKFLRQELAAAEQSKLEAREEGARLAIWAGSRAIRDLHDGLNSGVTGIRNAALTEAMDAVNFLSIESILKGKP